MIANSLSTRRAAGVLSVALLGALLLVGRAAAAPELVISTSEVVLGDSVEVELRDVDPSQSYQIALDLTDGFNSTWRSQTALVAEDFIATDRAGVFRLRDPHRLFWAAERVRVDESVTPDQAPNAAARSTLTLSRDGAALNSVQLVQWIQGPRVRRTEASDGVVGSLYAPRRASGVGVLVIGGSGGGMTWSQQMAAILASKGHTALGIAYFGARDLPANIDQIPLEYFRAALDQLRRARGVDAGKIVIVAQSWGSIAALLLGAQYDDIAGVIAYVPGSANFEGIVPRRWTNHSSWTLGGVDVPFARRRLAEGYSEPNDQIQRWMMLLGEQEQFTRGAIAIEQVRGRVLLLSAPEDRIWPSTYMSQQLVRRATANGAADRVQHVSVENAGHGITQPPFTPTTTVAARNGGTAEGNAAGRLASWTEVLRFLEITRTGATPAQ